jgi:hypothetical protein
LHPTAPTSFVNGKEVLVDSANYRNDDSEFSASELTHRNTFLRDVCIRDLQDAVITVQQYYDSIDQKDCGTVRPLNWEAWKEYLRFYQQQQQQQSSTVSASHRKDDVHNATTSNMETVIPRDPTLFMGLDDILTHDEQEYITRMFVSGVTETVAQAAYLLHSIVVTNITKPARTSSASTSRHHSNTTASTSSRTATTTTNTSVARKKSTAQIEHEQKVRKRFPLPTHMPRVITMPPYNPLEQHKNPPLKFVPSKPGTSNSSSTSSTAPTTQPPTELTIGSVHGVAGRVGIRRGDVVTHINGERIMTYSEFTIALQYVLAEEYVTITVNANDAIAQQLLHRAQQMKQQNIRFHS